jgi:hypothetical protein
LRQFVKAGSTQVIANASAPRISRNGPDGSESRFGILVHGSKFDECERSLVETDANLPVQDGSAIGEANCNCDDGQQRRQDNERRYSENNVERPLGKAGETGQRFMRSGIR